MVEDPGLVLTLAFVLWNMNGRHSQVFPGWVANDRSVVSITPESYILKAKKFAEPLFQEKNLRKKCENPGVIFGPFGGNFGPFWVFFGQFWIILGHSGTI